MAKRRVPEGIQLTNKRKPNIELTSTTTRSKQPSNFKDRLSNPTNNTTNKRLELPTKLISKPIPKIKSSTTNRSKQVPKIESSTTNRSKQVPKIESPTLNNLRSKKPIDSTTGNNTTSFLSRKNLQGTRNLERPKIEPISLGNIRSRPTTNIIRDSKPTNIPTINNISDSKVPLGIGQVPRMARNRPLRLSEL